VDSREGCGPVPEEPDANSPRAHDGKPFFLWQVLRLRPQGGSTIGAHPRIGCGYLRDLLEGPLHHGVDRRTPIIAVMRPASDR
jgi:hypothetical protein